MEIKYQPISKNLMDKINAVKEGAAEKTCLKGLLSVAGKQRTEILERVGQAE